MPVDGGESGRSVRDLQRGTDTLVVVLHGAPTGTWGQQREQQRGRVENALTTSE